MWLPCPFNTDKKGDAVAADELEAIFRRFWSQHLGHWADTFLDAVAEDTRSSFWRVWAKTLKRELAQFFAGIELTEIMAGLEIPIADISSSQNLKE